MRITDRKKDVIKSGGEWICSIDLENVAVACPGREDRRGGRRAASEMGGAAAAGDRGARGRRGRPRPRCWSTWQPRIVKWWLPDDVVFAAVPLTATGKIDKKVLRLTYQDKYRA